MRNYLAIIAGVVLLVGLLAPTANATAVVLAAADQAQKAKIGKDKAAKQGKRAEKMLHETEMADAEMEDADELEDARARAKGYKNKPHKRSDEDSQSLDDPDSNDASPDDKSEKSLDDGSFDDQSEESADGDSGDKSNKAARKGERGEHGRMKAEEKRAANKQRQTEKREMVETYQEDARATRAAGKLEEAADAVDDPDAAATEAQQKKAKKPWWRFWGN